LQAPTVPVQATQQQQQRKRGDTARLHCSAWHRCSSRC
jgi:hypothetical protein